MGTRASHRGLSPFATSRICKPRLGPRAYSMSPDSTAEAPSPPTSPDRENDVPGWPELGAGAPALLPPLPQATSERATRNGATAARAAGPVCRADAFRTKLSRCRRGSADITAFSSGAEGP